MADNPENVLEQLAELIVKRGGSAFVRDPRERALTRRTPGEREKKASNLMFKAATKNLNTAVAAFDKLSKSTENTAAQIRQQVELNSHFLEKAFENIDKSWVSASRLEKVPEHFRSAFEQSNSVFVQNMADTIDELSDVFRVQDQLIAMSDLTKKLEVLSDKEKLSVKEWERLQKEAKAAGVNLKDLGLKVKQRVVPAMEDGKRVFKVVGVTVKNYDEATKNLAKNTKSLSKAFKQAAVKTAKGGSAFEKLIDGIPIVGKMIAGVGAALMAPLKMFVEEQRLIRQRAAADIEARFAVEGLGVSLRDAITIVSKNRDIFHAVNQTGGDYLKTLKDTRDVLVEYGFDSKEAANAAAAFTRNVRMFGNQMINTTAAVERQTKVYIENFRALAMTTEEFAELTRELVSYTSVRESLAKMERKQREAYVRGLQVQTAYYRSLGFAEEQAKAVAKTFADIAAESPIERMKKAARIRAMAGAVGLGAEGAEIQRLMVALPTLGGEERAAAERRLASLFTATSNQLMTRMGRSIGENIAFGTLAMRTSFMDYAKLFESRSKEGQAFDKEAASAETKARETGNTLISKGLNLLDQILAGMQTSTYLLGIIAGGGMLKLAGKTGKEALGLLAQGMFSKEAMKKLAASGAAGAGVVALLSQLGVGEGTEAEMKRIQTTDQLLKRSEGIDKKIFELQERLKTAKGEEKTALESGLAAYLKVQEQLQQNAIEEAKKGNMNIDKLIQQGWDIHEEDKAREDMAKEQESRDRERGYSIIWSRQPASAIAGTR